MTDTPPKSNRRRWRWLVVGVLLVFASGVAVSCGVHSDIWTIPDGWHQVRLGDSATTLVGLVGQPLSVDELPGGEMHLYPAYRPEILRWKSVWRSLGLLPASSRRADIIAVYLNTNGRIREIVGDRFTLRADNRTE